MQTVIARSCRVLGVDTSLRSTGTGIVQAEGSRYTAVHHGLDRKSVV